VKKTFLVMMVMGLAAASPAWADDARATKSAPNQAAPNHTYLGVMVESLPSALSSHLAGIVPKGQGVLVTQVSKDSPAAKGGIQADDVLTKYDDHPLTSAEQLVDLVRGDKSGHAVAVDFIRAGKAGACKVVLAERESNNASEKSRVFKLQPGERLQEMFEEFGSNGSGKGWEDFDAMKLTKLDGKRWRAEIDFRDKDGKKEHKSFEGTREELRKNIQAEKELPVDEQHHLLRVLNLHEPVIEFHLPPFDKLGPDF